MSFRRCRIAPIAAAAILAVNGCDNAGSDLGLTVLGTGTVPVQVYLDRDGSKTFNQADTLFPGAIVRLHPALGGKVIQTAQTNVVAGIASLEGVSVGDYSVSVDPASIGDSISVAQILFPLVRIEPNEISTLVVVRLSYPDVSILQARLSPLGKRVLIRGRILAGVQSFRDTTSHMIDTSTTIRLTKASLRGGGSGNSPGDTVTVLGTVSSRGGQPTLDQAVISVFGGRPAPVPISVSSAVAATAQGGALDAGLVLVSNMVISESAAQAPDYRVVASDGSGALTIIIDGNITINPVAFLVGRTITVRGVLVPDGLGGWRLKPRDGGDITLF